MEQLTCWTPTLSAWYTSMSLALAVYALCTCRMITGILSNNIVITRSYHILSITPYYHRFVFAGLASGAVSVLTTHFWRL